MSESHVPAEQVPNGGLPMNEVEKTPASAPAPAAAPVVGAVVQPGQQQPEWKPPAGRATRPPASADTFLATKAGFSVAPPKPSAEPGKEEEQPRAPDGIYSNTVQVSGSVVTNYKQSCGCSIPKALYLFFNIILLLVTLAEMAFAILALTTGRDPWIDRLYLAGLVGSISAFLLWPLGFFHWKWYRVCCCCASSSGSAHCSTFLVLFLFLNQAMIFYIAHLGRVNYGKENDITVIHVLYPFYTGYVFVPLAIGVMVMAMGRTISTNLESIQCEVKGGADPVSTSSSPAGSAVVPIGPAGTIVINDTIRCSVQDVESLKPNVMGVSINGTRLILFERSSGLRIDVTMEEDPAVVIPAMRALFPTLPVSA